MSATTIEKLPSQSAAITVQIHKVKITKTGIHIEYDRINDKKTDAIKLTSEDAPQPDFDKAFQALLEDVIDICLLDPDGWEQARVTGVTIKYQDDGLGAVITTQNHASDLDVPIIINTPFLAAGSISNEFENKIRAVVDEAIAFIEGKRAQLSLF